MHTFEELEPGSEQCIRLLHKAKKAGDWELCKELARFLMALDESGDTLREAVGTLDLEPPPTPFVNGRFFERTAIAAPIDNVEAQQTASQRSTNIVASQSQDHT